MGGRHLVPWTWGAQLGRTAPGQDIVLTPCGDYSAHSEMKDINTREGHSSGEGGWTQNN